MVNLANKLSLNRASNTTFDNSVEQYEVLNKLIHKARNTAFGKAHYFEHILQFDEIYQPFKSNIPLTNYEDFKHHWLDQALEGSSNVIWPGKINYFALSSGTTSDRSKHIPVTEEMLKQFHRTSVKQIMDLHHLDLPASFYKTKVLVIGGSTDLIETEHYFKGDLSGILAKRKSFAFSPFVRPKKKIARIKDWELKKKAIIEKAVKWNIGAIAGVPSWITQLLEEIVEHYQVKSIHELWPNLKIIAHGGIHIEPYKQRLNRFLSKDVTYVNTYLASEGYFAYQKKANGDLELLTQNGIYYEFIEKQYFERVRANDLKGIPTLSTKEIEPNKEYAMVISTESGLWRYIIGDVVVFSNTDNLSLSISGRISNSLNVHGEHLSEANMTQAIKETAITLGVHVEQFCVYSDNNKNRHNWYLGLNQRVDCNLFETVLNSNLCMLNEDYETVRNHILKGPKVKAIPIEKFNEYMQVLNKQGGQHKFPTVMNYTQAQKWERFLTNMNSLD